MNVCRGEERCSGCNQRLYDPENPDRGFYTALEPEEFWHYDCWKRDHPSIEEMDQKVKTTAAKARKLLDKLRNKLSRP